MQPLDTAALAGASLLAGFAVAEVTGVRAVGGVVLAVAAVVCTVQWRRFAGIAVAAVLLAAYVGAFVAAHLLARLIGGWPSVVLVSVAVAAASLYATCLAPARR